MLLFHLRLVRGFHKRRPQSGGLSSADILQTRGVLQMKAFTRFGPKNFRFFEIYGVVRTDKGGGGLSQCLHLRTRGEEINFSRFCADVFHGRPLTRCRIASLIQIPYGHLSPSQDIFQIHLGNN